MKRDKTNFCIELCVKKLPFIKRTSCFSRKWKLVIFNSKVVRDNENNSVITINNNLYRFLSNYVLRIGLRD